MPFCSFAKDSAMFDSTPIENMFLLEYLPTAPEGFLRVYLYARMLCLHPELGGEIDDLARALHMDEEAVFNAFHYWEQQGLVEKLSDRPAAYAILPLRSGTAIVSDLDRDYYKYREYNSSLQDLFGGSELLEPKHYKIANDWLNVLGYTQEAALKLLEYELHLPGGRKPASVFRRADKRAVEWADRGIHNLEDVEKAIAYDDRIYSMAKLVMKQLAISRRATANELDCVRRWIYDWNLDEQTVLAACEHTTKSRAPSIAYLDAILKARVDSGADQHFDHMKEILRELGAAGNVPTPDQLRRYDALLKQGFEAETLLMAAVQCARKGKHSFEDLEWMVQKWGESGVRTHAQAEKYISDMQQATAQVRALLETAGTNRRPNLDDLERYGQWMRKHRPELIRYAAECARGMAKPMLYMEKILGEWEKAGLTTPEAARSARSAAKAAPAAKDYQQHSYTEADFSDQFFYNPANDFSDGGEGK